MNVSDITVSDGKGAVVRLTDAGDRLWKVTIDDALSRLPFSNFLTTVQLQLLLVALQKLQI